MALSNLPPGVRDSDIPGNRPEDIEFDRLFERFAEMTFAEIQERAGSHLNELIGELLVQAIEKVRDEVLEYAAAEWTLDTLRRVMGVGDPGEHEPEPDAEE